MRTINIANLETACWIARLGSFTRAGEELYLAQPTVAPTSSLVTGYDFISDAATSKIATGRARPATLTSPRDS